jgi:hypothetical protein
MIKSIGKYQKSKLKSKDSEADKRKHDVFPLFREIK